MASPYGNVLHHAENITHSQFAFTTTEAGNYLVCFWLTDQKLEPGFEISVNLDWRTGIAAKDWESVAKKEKIEAPNSLFTFSYFSATCNIHSNASTLFSFRALNSSYGNSRERSKLSMKIYFISGTGN